MKILTISLLSCTLCMAQFSKQKIISEENSSLVRAVTVGDINNDGTLDVIRAARTNNNIAWFSNTNGLGDFSPLQLAANNDFNTDIEAVDLDNDGDLDLVSVSFTLENVFWLENLDGLGSYGPVNNIAIEPDLIGIGVGDIDGDGFIDIAYGGNFARLFWIKNLGNGTFATPTLIKNFGTNGIDIKIVDIDGDNFNDILTTNTGLNIVSWYKNMDGLGTFSEELVIQNADSPSSTVSVIAIDIDGDLDLDVITASSGTLNNILWYENENGLGDFSSGNLVTNDIIQPRKIASGDIDNDGDNDLVSVSVGDNNVAWFANNGNGFFGAKQVISTNVNSPRDIVTADVDGDGDLDIISASQNDSKVAWYENFTILFTEEIEIEGFSIAPNPASTTVSFKASNAGAFDIAVYDVLGKEVLNATAVETLNVQALTSGIYLVKATQNGISSVAKLVIE